MAETDIDEATIERQVHAFYTAARTDAVLGPIFEARVTDWDCHLGRMCAFWSSVALMSGRYHGTPMQAHINLPIEDAHFARWLDLWGHTARAQCAPSAAERFILLAGRIAQSLSHGVAVHRGALPTQRVSHHHAEGVSS